jgi:hypothetical protein
MLLRRSLVELRVVRKVGAEEQDKIGEPFFSPGELVTMVS